jgi:hypothetical protein
VPHLHRPGMAHREMLVDNAINKNGEAFA